jgi:hypothetical protein
MRSDNEDAALPGHRPSTRKSGPGQASKTCCQEGQKRERAAHDVQPARPRRSARSRDERRSNFYRDAHKLDLTDSRRSRPGRRLLPAKDWAERSHQLPEGADEPRRG